MELELGFGVWFGVEFLGGGRGRKNREKLPVQSSFCSFPVTFLHELNYTESINGTQEQDQKLDLQQLENLSMLSNRRRHNPNAFKIELCNLDTVSHGGRKLDCNMSSTSHFSDISWHLK